jgi:hypothetical protein
MLDIRITTYPVVVPLMVIADRLKLLLYESYFSFHSQAFSSTYRLQFSSSIRLGQEPF